MDWQGILAGIGIAGIISSALNYLLSNAAERKKNSFAKKEETYIGLLDALYQADVDKSSINAENYGRWHNRLVLFGSPEAIKFSQLVIDTKPGSEDRRVALDTLMQMMRDDLKIDMGKLK